MAWLWRPPGTPSRRCRPTAVDSIRHSDSTFSLALKDEGEVIKGVAGRSDLGVWSLSPEPLESSGTDAARVRVAQGPRSGLNAVLGARPGDESEEELIAALREMS